MNKKIYLLGGGRCASGSDESGLYLYDYDPETGKLKLNSVAYREVSVGQQCFDNDTYCSYVCEEIDNQRGQVGGGGYVWSFKMNPDTMNIELMNSRPSLGSMPAYVCVDKSKQYAIVVHHCLSHHVTKLVKKDDGSFDTEVIFEEGSVILFRLNSDGSFGEACDVMTFCGDRKPGIRTFAHPHWVGAAPFGDMVIVTDCGADRIFSFRIDRENGKLILLDTTETAVGYWPRYGAFHPAKPIFYDTNEQTPVVQGYTYDPETGKLDLITEAPMLLDSFKNGRDIHAESSDIAMHPSGKFLYAALRAYNCIAVYDIHDDGTISLKQNVDCGGENPRGICVTPDGKYFYSCNRDTPNTFCFSIGEDGMLTAQGVAAEDCISTLVPVLK